MNADECVNAQPNLSSKHGHRLQGASLLLHLLLQFVYQVLFEGQGALRLIQPAAHVLTLRERRGDTTPYRQGCLSLGPPEEETPLKRPHLKDRVVYLSVSVVMTLTWYR